MTGASAGGAVVRPSWSRERRAPVKNDKAHDVPLSESLAPILAEHIRLLRPVAVTLPWEPDGKPVTFRLIFTLWGTALHRGWK